MPVLLPFGDALRDELGSPRRARKLGSSPRSRVWQVELASGPAIVKQVVEAPDADERYARELAALRIAERATPAIVPAVLGVDPVERVLVLARIEHRRPARNWVVDYATALARLHATGQAADIGAVPRWAGPTERDVDAFLALARAFEVPVDAGVQGELDGLLGRLAAAPGHALLHGDPCPGNDLHTAAGVRFIDFEQASIGNGLTELAYLRIGFPTCWCSTRPDDALIEEAEAAYAATWRASTGSEPVGDPGDACAGWLLRGDALVERQFRGRDHLARIPTEDWTWGTATARQRLVHRLGVVGELGEMAGFRVLCRGMRDAMLARWPKLRALPARRPR
ncbi:MAG TPA: aminoglycoside phosphotransferase family protein [Pseudonocardiaceae bacterium]|jgi:tRNA A-37 threonylcarbamoyl transferase component Bud32